MALDTELVNAPAPLPATAHAAIAAEYKALRIPRFRIHKRKPPLRRRRSTPWHLEDRVTGQQFLVNTWQGALELAEAMTR